MKKKLKWVLSLSLIAAICVSSAYSFLDSDDTKQNCFCVGEVSCYLHEETWYTETPSGETLKNDTDSDGVNEFAKNIVPGQPFTMDSTIENNGTCDAFCFIALTVPTAKTSEGDKELFSYTPDDNWTQLTLKDYSDGYNSVAATASAPGSHTYYYYFNNKSGDTSKKNILSVGKTTSCIFKDKKIVYEDIKGVDYLALANAKQVKINVAGYACQTKLESSVFSSPSAAWNVIADLNSLPRSTT